MSVIPPPQPSATESSFTPQQLQQLQLQSPLIQGQLLQIFDYGVVLNGASGCGKSELTLSLLQQGHKLIADDAFYVTKTNEHDIGFTDSKLFGLLHLRGLGMLDIGQLFGKDSLLHSARLDLCITLSNQTSATTPLLLSDQVQTTILHHHSLPLYRINPSHYNNPAMVIELLIAQTFAPVSDRIAALLVNRI